jgi:hypothetical protein
MLCSARESHSAGGMTVVVHKAQTDWFITVTEYETGGNWGMRAPRLFCTAYTGNVSVGANGIIPTFAPRAVLQYILYVSNGSLSNRLNVLLWIGPFIVCTTEKEKKINLGIRALIGC